MAENKLFNYIKSPEIRSTRREAIHYSATNTKITRLFLFLVSILANNGVEGGFAAKVTLTRARSIFWQDKEKELKIPRNICSLNWTPDTDFIRRSVELLI